VSKPDIVNQLPNGGTEELHIKKHVRADGSRSIIRKIRDANGGVLEV